MEAEAVKRKRSETSSTSDLDTSKTTEQNVNKTNSDTDTKSKSRKQKKKEARLEMKEAELNLDLSQAHRTRKEPTNIEQQLTEINTKLNYVITKSDTSIIKDLIKETLLELKDTLVGSLTKKIECIEGELHDKAVENEQLKKKIDEMNKKLTEKEEEHKLLENQFEYEKNKTAEMINEQEQYSRRNSIRITALNNDEQKETEQGAIDKVLDFLQKQLKINLTARDIDTAHRLGKFQENKNRSMIVKFVNRHAKAQILQTKKILKGTGVSIFEDLTRLNNEVLASARKKMPNEVDQSWSRNGKLFLKWKANGRIEQIKYSDYKHWLEMPWP